MGSAFWDGMKQGRVASIETMGEDIVVRGAPATGIVNDMRADGRLTGGGESKGVVFEIEVSLELGATVNEGDEILARGERGKVNAVRNIGGSYVLEVGPGNRGVEIDALR